MQLNPMVGRRGLPGNAVASAAATTVVANSGLWTVGLSDTVCNVSTAILGDQSLLGYIYFPCHINPYHSMLGFLLFPHKPHIGQVGLSVFYMIGNMSS